MTRTMTTTARATAPAMAAMGIMRGTEVMTLKGVRPVEGLSVGDRIITRSGACALRAVRRTAANGYALRFDTPQVVLLSEGQVHSETGLPFAA